MSTEIVMFSSSNIQQNLKYIETPDDIEHSAHIR